MSAIKVLMQGPKGSSTLLWEQRLDDIDWLIKKAKLDDCPETRKSLNEFRALATSEYRRDVRKWVALDYDLTNPNLVESEKAELWKKRDHACDQVRWGGNALKDLYQELIDKATRHAEEYSKRIAERRARDVDVGPLSNSDLLNESEEGSS